MKVEVQDGCTARWRQPFHFTANNSPVSAHRVKLALFFSKLQEIRDIHGKNESLLIVNVKRIGKK